MNLPKHFEGKKLDFTQKYLEIGDEVTLLPESKFSYYMDIMNPTFGLGVVKTKYNEDFYEVIWNTNSDGSKIKEKNDCYIAIEDIVKVVDIDTNKVINFNNKQIQII